MNKRALGRSGLQIAPLVLGGNVFGWTADEKTSFELLDGFVAAGLNAVDTADIYSAWAKGNQGGESETIIGKWFQRNPGNRAKVVLITKVGWEFSPESGGLSERWVTQAVEDSLRRLQTDTIDLYLSHRPDPHTPYEETLAAFEKLLRGARSAPWAPPTWMRGNWPSRWQSPARTTCRATTYCSRSTTSTTAPVSTAPCVT